MPEYAGKGAGSAWMNSWAVCFIIPSHFNVFSVPQLPRVDWEFHAALCMEGWEGKTRWQWWQDPAVTPSHPIAPNLWGCLHSGRKGLCTTQSFLGMTFNFFPPSWPLLCESSQFFHLGEVGWNWLMPPFDSLPSPVFTQDVHPWPFPISWHLYSCTTPEYATQVIALSAAALDGGVLQSVLAKRGEEKEKAPWNAVKRDNLRTSKWCERN